MLLCLASEKGKHFKVGPTVYSANDQIGFLCLCAIVPCALPQRTNVRMNAGLDKHWRWRGSSSRVQVYTTTSIDFPNAKVLRINERNHYDWDLLKYRATHLRKIFLAAEMRLVSSVAFFPAQFCSRPSTKGYSRSTPAAWQGTA